MTTPIPEHLEARMTKTYDIEEIEAVEVEFDPDFQALLAFRDALMAIEGISTDSEADTGSYTYRYAKLPTVLAEVKRVCEMFHLAVTQTATATETMLAVGTTLIHQSGGTYQPDPIMLPMPKSAQALGSAITYLRRYALVTIFGIPVADDDGAAATIDAQTQPGRRTEAERMIREYIAVMTSEQRKVYVDTFKGQFGMSLSDLPASRHGDALTFTKEWVKGYTAEDKAEHPGDPEQAIGESTS